MDVYKTLQITVRGNEVSIKEVESYEKITSGKGNPNEIKCKRETRSKVLQSLIKACVRYFSSFFYF